MRDTARLPQSPTNRAYNEPVCVQETIFWANFGLSLGQKLIYGRKQKFRYPSNKRTTWAPLSHWFLAGNGTKWAKNTKMWPKITTNAYFWPNFAVFGPKFPIIMGGSKSQNHRVGCIKTADKPLKTKNNHQHSIPFIKGNHCYTTPAI